MTITQLQHDPRLCYPAKKDLPFLPMDILAVSRNKTLISFRDSQTVSPDKIYKKINACSRYIENHHEFPKSDLLFYGIENDSPLAPLIFWDAAHQINIGHTITVMEDYQQDFYLERTYFANAFVLEEKTENQAVFRKIKPLLVEEDAGLDRWSFCIPAGPSDAIGLNIIVKRILELDIAEKEILLCGKPGKDFLYWDNVRIVGEDIPAPPVWITRKKNVLAQEAQYENLCILHDRVFLPLNFLNVIKKFGDGFSFAAFQSIWFDDVFNLSPVRYSDYGCALKPQQGNFIKVEQKNKSTVYSSSLFSEIEKQEFIIANPLRYQQNSYLTGSLYITKRKLWLDTPQNENLYWAQYEDIEHAGRCSEKGIPHRIIPGGFTQTLYARPILYPAGYSTYLSSKGSSQKIRNAIPLPTSWLKPLIKLSFMEAGKRLVRFTKKYCGNNTPGRNHKIFIRDIIFSILSAEIPFKQSALNEYLDDIERDVLCDQMGFVTRDYLIDQFIIHKTNAKVNVGKNFNDLIFQFSMRPNGKRFYHQLEEYFPGRNFKIKIGSFLSAIKLARLDGEYFYHPDGRRGYYQAILESTPFIDYMERKA